MSKRFLKDLTGQLYGRLEVLSFHPCDNDKSFWSCRCDCGEHRIVQGYKLTSGRSQSCGCLKADKQRELKTKHGEWGSATYNSWRAMLNRCNNPKNNRYQYYGAKGVMVCHEWSDSYSAFRADMGERPEGKTLDRINPEGHYCQANCRWATAVEQRNNRRGSSMQRGEE